MILLSFLSLILASVICAVARFYPGLRVLALGWAEVRMVFLSFITAAVFHGVAQETKKKNEEGAKAKKSRVCLLR